MNIALIPGDGVGPEVLAEACKALEVLQRRFHLPIALQTYDIGAARYLATGEVLPDSVQQELARHDAILFGAIGSPDVPPGVLERGLLLKLRFDFNQYINYRPVRLYPGVQCPLAGKTPADVDFVVIRENSEDLYVGRGEWTGQGTPDETAIQYSVNTRRAIERTVRYACDIAMTRPRKQLHFVGKTNVLTIGHKLWQQVFDEVLGAYPQVKPLYHHVDACCIHMVRNPGQYDVIVTPNMFGDIITDLGAAIQGGLGIPASGNLNPPRQYPSMFEPIHGSAPDIAGQGKANPVAACFSLAMMLDFLGHPQPARALHDAVADLLAEGRIRTPDLGGTSSTAQVGDAIAQKLA